MFVVLWNEGGTKGYRDLYDEGLFRPGAEEPFVEHLIIPEAARSHILARFSLKIDGLVAVLDYAGRHTAFNKPNTSPGQTRITFSDDTFTDIAKYEWRHDGGTYFEPDVSIQDNSVSRQEVEGDQVLAGHMRRERKPALVASKIEAMLREGRRLACEACFFDFGDRYGELGEGVCEVHHRDPLQTGVRVTALSDLAILCANCHRVIHRTRPIMSVEDLRRLVERRRSGRVAASPA